MTTFNGARMRQTRRKLHISIAELARRIGAARTQVSAWEHERYEPNLANLQRIANALGVSADYLLERDN